jgi:hypothetical protein
MLKTIFLAATALSYVTATVSYLLPLLRIVPYDI